MVAMNSSSVKTNDLSNWFEIGKIVKPQGIAGEIRVLPTTDDPSRFELLDEVHVSNGLGVASYKLNTVRYHKGLVLLKLAGITDRNAAEKLVGSVIIIPPEQALPLDDNEYFIRDLIGLEVVTEDGTSLGEVTDVRSTGANDVYTVCDSEGKTFMIPAIKDVVLAVSVSERRLTIRLMDGLLELKV